MNKVTCLNCRVQVDYGEGFRSFLKQSFRFSKNETIVSEKSEHDPSLTTLISILNVSK